MKKSLNPDVHPFVPKTPNQSPPFYLPQSSGELTLPTTSYYRPNFYSQWSMVDQNSFNYRYQQDHWRNRSQTRKKSQAQIIKSEKTVHPRTVTSFQQESDVPNSNTSSSEKKSIEGNHNPKSVKGNTIDLTELGFIKEPKPLTILKREDVNTKSIESKKPSLVTKYTESFPSLSNVESNPSEVTFSKAGFRSFVDVARSLPLPNPVTPVKKDEHNNRETDEDDEWEDTSDANKPTDLSKKSNSKTNKSKSKQPSAQVKTFKRKPTEFTLDKIITAKVTSTNNQIMKNKTLKASNKNEDNKDIPRNVLDSSAPTRRRGKEREVPKPKKPTLMKKTILKEKEDKRKILEEPVVQSANDEDVLIEQFTQAVSVLEAQQEEAHLRCKSEIDEMAKRIIHSSSYREYCEQALTEQIDETVELLLNDLIKFQDRLFHKDPLKAKIRKRLSFGLREVSKYVALKKLKCIILAPDIEKTKIDGILDRTVEALIESAAACGIPVLFALSRNRLGHVCRKRGSVSCCGIFNYDGTEISFKKLLELCEISKNEYKLVYNDVVNYIESLDDTGFVWMKQTLIHHIPAQFNIYKEQLRRQNAQLLKSKNRIKCTN